jgi:hypothetical protein
MISKLFSTAVFSFCVGSAYKFKTTLALVQVSIGFVSRWLVDPLQQGCDCSNLWDPRGVSAAMHVGTRWNKQGYLVFGTHSARDTVEPFIVFSSMIPFRMTFGKSRT